MGSAVYQLLDLLGANHLCCALGRGKIRILCLHGVEDESSDDAMTSAALRRQLTALARRYNVVRLEDAVEMLAGRRPALKRCAVITFDDGYRNFLTHAVPVLLDLRLPATLFVATRFVGHGEPLWFDRLASALSGPGPEELRLPLPRLTDVAHMTPEPGRWIGRLVRENESDAPIELWAIPVRSADQRRTALASLKRYFKRLDLEQVTPCLAEIERQMGRRLESTNLDARIAPLSWDELRGLPDFISIGAHTASHQILGVVNEARMRVEVTESKAAVEANLSRPCRLFAYPNGGPGDFNATSERVLREAGFVCGLTTIDRAAQVGDNLFALPRVAAGRAEPVARFQARLSGLLGILLRLRARLRSLGARTPEAALDSSHNPWHSQARADAAAH